MDVHDIWVSNDNVFINIPKNNWNLYLTCGFCVSHVKRPNPIIRFFQRVLLGWVWKPIK